jgi:hypothetical protein
MSDRKPVIIAVAVGGLALAANGAAAVIAVSANSPPEAAALGIAGLTAAFIGLLTTIIWAFRSEPVPPPRLGERVFTPWSEREEPLPPLVEAFGRSSLALARTAPAPAPVATPAASDGRVIYLREWLKARGTQHANA